MRVVQLFILISVLLTGRANAQLVGDMDDETKLYAQTKQVNQFFRRFNGEESEKGDRYYPRDREYHSAKLRKKYLGILFDKDNPSIKSDLKVLFAKEVLDKEVILNFHGGHWFSEVQTVFTMQGKDHTVTLFMELEKDHDGSKWVISKVFSELFEPYFKRDTTRVGKFLHPLSHELAFMNFRKAFASDSVSQFAVKKFRPDYLSLFLYEVGRGNLKFKSVTNQRFHFFQINGWYFEVSDFNRPGYNTGWLISNLVKINNDAEKELLKKHFYYE